MGDYARFRFLLFICGVFHIILVWRSFTTGGPYLDRIGALRLLEANIGRVNTLSQLRYAPS